MELILAQDNVLEELFCTIMLSFFSTWQEMKAISTDFKKVTQIVKEQIHEALSSERLESLDKFRRNLAKHDYTKILEKREKRNRYVLQGFSMISRFLERIPMEHIDMKSSLESKLRIGCICSIRILSRNWDIVKKPLQLI